MAKPHDLILSIAGADLEPVTVQMPAAVAMPAASPWRTWWLQIVIGTGLVALLAVGGWIVNRRSFVR